MCSHRIFADISPANGGKAGIRVGPFNIVIEPDDDGFHASCLALKGLHTSGKTKEEALQNAKYAVSAYCESLLKHGESIPSVAHSGERK